MPPDAFAQTTTGLAVTCPHCGSGQSRTWVHPRRVEVDRLGDVVEVAPDGVGFLTRESSEILNDGTVMRLEFFCESGHQFAWVLRFQRGSTTFGMDYSMPDFDLVEYLDELPRT